MGDIKQIICGYAESKNHSWCVISQDSALKDAIVCYNRTISTSNSGLWRSENPFTSTLPEFILQLVLALLLNQLLIVIFKLLHLPRISAEILSGVIWGASVVGKSTFGREILFPFKSMVILETVGNLSLIYYMFLVGLEVDIKPVLRAGSKPLTIALAGMLIPLPIGIALYFYAIQSQKKLVYQSANQSRGHIFWGVVLTTSNFPDLARILADFKLLYSDVGRTALSSAIITDLFSWILLVVSVIVSNPDKFYIKLPLIVAFIAIFVFIIRPALAWIIPRVSQDENYNDTHMCFILAAVALCGFIADYIGSHSILGAFLFGLAMPKGEFKHVLMEKIEDFVAGILMPTFFLIIGFRTDFRTHAGKSGIHLNTIVEVVVLSIVSKATTTFMAAFFINKMPLQDSFVLGILMNAKGLMSLIILSLGRDMRALDAQKFYIMMIAIWTMTTIVGPILALTYKGVKPSGEYKHKTIRSIGRNTEFKIITCLTSARNTNGFINLIEASNPTKQSPIYVFAVQLVELASRNAQAMLIMQDTFKIHDDSNSVNSNSSNHFTNPFTDLKNRNESVFVEHLTAVSSYATMHEDICTIAEEKKTTLIVLPYHKQSTLEGGIENADSPFRVINKNVMDTATCSVAIFVDRGLNLSTIIYSSEHEHSNSNINTSDARCHIAMLFVGGPDDCEALAYVWRMCENPRTSLSVMRFVNIVERNSLKEEEGDDDNKDEKNNEKYEMEKRLDDKYIEQLKFKTSSNPSMFVQFIEEMVRDGNEIVKIIEKLGNQFDLIVVGRGKQVVCPLMNGRLSDWSECPELGPLGDLLVSTSNCAVNTSILVVQKGHEVEGSIYEQEGDGIAGTLGANNGRLTLQVQEAPKVEFAPFINRRNQIAEAS